MATEKLIAYGALETALTAADDARLDALSGAATATVAAAGANDAAILATSAAGIIPAPDLASIPTTPGLYRTLDTGYVYERLVGGGAPERREYLEAAARTAVEAAQLVADTAKNAVGASLAVLSMRGQADGAQLADGSRWLWQASGTPDGALIVAASDGGVWVRELGPGSLISVNWFASAGGVMDQAALTRWTNYARVNGGRFVLMPGTEATGHITLNQPAKYLTVAAHGARLTATNTANPAILLQEAYAGGDIAGLSIRHAGIGMSPPLSDLDPRRTPGGHGLMVIGGRNWNFVGNSFQGVASMAMLLIALDGFSVTANNIDVAMGDGIHAAFGSRRGTIANNNIRHTGDDGIPVVSPRLWPAGIPASVGTAGAVAPTCADIAVTGNTVVNSAARGICLAGGERITVTGNVINTTRKAGMILMRDEVNDTLTLNNITVTGNHVSGGGTYNNTTPGGRAGIWVRAGAANIELADNHVHDSAEEGILVQDAPAVVVTGGYIHDNVLDGLRIVGTLSSNIAVTGGTYRTNRNGIQAEVSCEVSGVLAQENRGDGVFAVGAGVLVAVLGGNIRNNGTSGNEQASAAAGATLELHNTRVRGSRLYGLVANDGSTVRAINCDLRGSGTTPMVAGGTGVIASLRSLGQADIGTIS